MSGVNPVGIGLFPPVDVSPGAPPVTAAAVSAALFAGGIGPFRYATQLFTDTQVRALALGATTFFPMAVAVAGKTVVPFFGWFWHTQTAWAGGGSLAQSFNYNIGGGVANVLGTGTVAMSFNGVTAVQQGVQMNAGSLNTQVANDSLGLAFGLRMAKDPTAITTGTGTLRYSLLYLYFDPVTGLFS